MYGCRDDRDVDRQAIEEMSDELKVCTSFICNEVAADISTVLHKSDFRAVKVKECVAVPKSKKLLQFTLDDGTGTDRTILSGIHAYY